MSNFDASCPLLLTEKHYNHDEIWILQNSSSKTVCFACAVETLDDNASLNVRKRKMIADILDLLTTNRSIWEIFTRQKSTLCRTGNVLLRLLSSKDKQLSVLVVETLGALVQRSGEGNAISLFDSLLSEITKKRDGKTQESLAPYICLLGKFLRSSNSLVKTILQSYQCILEMIVENISNLPEKQAVSYWYVLAQIYRSNQSKNASIRLSKTVMEKVVQAVGESTSKDLQLNILAVFMSFANNPVLRELIVEQDGRDSSHSKSALANMMKKLMLSTNKDVQIGAIQCLAAILNVPSSAKAREVNTNYSETLIAKGLCEFLFELLSTSDRVLTASVINCLYQFVACKSFFTACHIVYGIEPILESLSAAAKANDKFLLRPALQLLVRIFCNSKGYFDAIARHVKRVMSILNEVSETQDASILNLAISAALEALKKVSRDQVDFEVLESLMVRYGKYLSKMAAVESKRASVDPVLQSLLKNTLNFVRTGIMLHASIDASLDSGSIARLNVGEEFCLPETLSEEISGERALPLQNFLHEVEFVADTYLIPSTVVLLPRLKDPQLFATFFDVLAILLDIGSGNALAKKLCEASFVRIAAEVKSGLSKENNANEDGRSIDNFFIHLACKLDDTCDKASLKATLSETLPSIRSLPSEWALFFSDSASSNIDATIVCPVWCACISLVYLSVRFGDPLWKHETILKCISNCVSNETSTANMPLVVKRHVIYLWANARTRSRIADNCIFLADQKLFSIIEDECATRDLFLPEECFILWILDYAEKSEIKFWALSVLFSQQNSEVDSPSTNPDNMTQTMTAYRKSLDFYSICLRILSLETPKIISRAFHVVCFVMGDIDDLECVVQIKEIIHKIILARASELHHPNLLALVNLYRYTLSSASSIISEVDLKLTNRLCNLFTECPYHGVRVMILNCLNQLIFHMQKSNGSSHAAVVCSEHFLKEVVSFLPQNLTFTGKQAQRVSSASLVFVSKLVSVVSAQRIQTTTIKSIIVNKKVIIAGLACPGSVLFQLACLQFWSNFLKLDKRQVIFLQNGEDPLHLDDEDLETLLIYHQNLLLHENKSVKELCIVGIPFVLKALKNVYDDFENPWNNFLLQHFAESIVVNSDLELHLKILLFLLRCSTDMETITGIASSVTGILRNRQQKVGSEATDVLLLEIVCIFVKAGQLSALQNREVNTFLHILEDRANGLLTEQLHLNEAKASAFLIFEEVLFTVYNEDHRTLENCIGDFKECKDMVARNLEERNQFKTANKIITKSSWK